MRLQQLESAIRPCKCRCRPFGSRFVGLTPLQHRAPYLQRTGRQFVDKLEREPKLFIVVI